MDGESSTNKKVWCGLGLSVSGEVKIAGFCEYGNELSVSIKLRSNFLTS